MNANVSSKENATDMSGNDESDAENETQASKTNVLLKEKSSMMVADLREEVDGNQLIGHLSGYHGYEIMMTLNGCMT